MSTITPNMNLIESTVNVDTGLAWEQNLNSSLTIIDGHNHSAGSGVQINPSGLNINATLPFNNNSATSLASTVFTQQASLATLNAVFVGTDGNLYFNDGNSNPSIKITAGGVVNATSSGISSGTATASFVSSVLVVNAASNTPADIQGGSILLGNNSAASKFLKLSPPAAMAANYTVTMPALPASTLPMQISSAGVISTGQITTAQITDASVTGAKIASATITGANVAASTIAGSNIVSNPNFGGTAAEVGSKYIAVGLSNFVIIRGGVSSGGGITIGEGFTVSVIGTGSYTITFSSVFADTPSVTLTPNTVGGVGGVMCWTETLGASAVTFVFKTAGGTFTNAAFTFIAVGSR